MRSTDMHRLLNVHGDLLHSTDNLRRVSDSQPPRVDSCVSPPPYILKRGRKAQVTWDEPVFSDNSRGALDVRRTHADAKWFPIGTTLVTYTATDKFGNNATCVIKVVVKGELKTDALTLCLLREFFQSKALGSCR